MLPTAAYLYCTLSTHLTILHFTISFMLPPFSTLKECAFLVHTGGTKQKMVLKQLMNVMYALWAHPPDFTVSFPSEYAKTLSESV